MAISAQISSLETPKTGRKGPNPYGYRGFGPFLGCFWGSQREIGLKTAILTPKRPKKAILGHFRVFLGWGGSKMTVLGVGGVIFGEGGVIFGGGGGQNGRFGVILGPKGSFLTLFGVGR